MFVKSESLEYIDNKGSTDEPTPYCHIILAGELLHNQVVLAETFESGSLEGLAVVRMGD